jgi:hypothetical protein
MVGFLFLLFFDRHKLQSEDFQLRKRSIELMEQKGDAGPRIIQSVEVIDERKAMELDQK